jgi:hypothetical protein
MAPVQFWSTPGLYIKWAARNKPAIFWSIVVGSVGPVMALVVPPMRARFGDGPRPQIPLTYPSESLWPVCSHIIVSHDWTQHLVQLRAKQPPLTRHPQYPRALAALLPATKTKLIAIFSHTSNLPIIRQVHLRYMYICSRYKSNTPLSLHHPHHRRRGQYKEISRPESWGRSIGLFSFPLSPICRFTNVKNTPARLSRVPFLCQSRSDLIKLLTLRR